MLNTLYLEEKSMSDEMKNEILNIKELIKNHNIPFSYPDYLIKNWNNSERSKFIKNLGFTLLSLNWVVPLSKWIGKRKCLEIMAGNGALSYCLQQQGINIFATDDFSWGPDNHWNKNKNYWTKIENIDATKAIEKYGKDIDIIIMSWPYMDDTAYNVLKTMRKINKNCVMIYIGENSGGCTADDEFFNNIVELENHNFYNAVSQFDSWIGIHDNLYLVK